MTIAGQVAKLGSGELDEGGIREHIWPLFSRVLRRDEIYLANHSLGRPLDRVADDVREGLDLWFERMDGAWDDDGWPAEIERFRGAVAKLIGLTDPKAVIPKTSAGQGLRAVLNSIPKDRASVVATRGEFDSVDFILKTYQSKGRADVRWVEPRVDPSSVPLIAAGDVLAAIGRGVDLVIVSAVLFSTGQILPKLAEIAAEARRVGALVLVDAYHAVGVVPVDMMAIGCDFMVGGSYKYTRGGPGACWLAVHPRVLESGLRTLDTGWFAKQDPFSYRRPDEPVAAEGGDAWLESTPPVLTMYQARAGLEFTWAIGVERLRRYGLEQLRVLRSSFADRGVACFHPESPEAFGAFALVPHSDASGLCKRLLRAGVNTDARGGNVRFGPDLLNTRNELIEAADRTARVLAQG